MEYKQTRWVCDFCKRDVKCGDVPPSGWQEVRMDMYGNVVHCCADVACTSRLELMCKNKELSEFAP